MTPDLKFHSAYATGLLIDAHPQVKSTNYVTARVEEETAEACQERKQEEEAETGARAGVLALKDKIAAVDAKRECLPHSSES